MNWRILSVGKPSFRWVKEGVETYAKRLSRYTNLDCRGLKRGTLEAFEHALGTGPVVCLDESGSLPSTLEVAGQIREWELDGVKDVTICIGGAEGLPKELIQRSNAVWSLGRMTLMHELALLVWMEQLYRVHTVLLNHPYHREG